MVGGCLKPSRFSQSIVSVIHILQRFAFVRRGRSWVPSPLAGEGQGEGKSSGNESTHPNEKCCNRLPKVAPIVLTVPLLPLLALRSTAAPPRHNPRQYRGPHSEKLGPWDFC